MYACMYVCMYSDVLPSTINFPCLHQVPVLETPDGPIFESNAIARYGMSAAIP